MYSLRAMFALNYFTKYGDNIKQHLAFTYRYTTDNSALLNNKHISFTHAQKRPFAAIQKQRCGYISGTISVTIAA